MISIFFTLCTAYDNRFRRTPRQVRNRKPLRCVFERVARGTNLEKLLSLDIFIYLKLTFTA